MEEYELRYSKEFLEKHNGIFIEHAGTVMNMDTEVCSNMILAYVAHGNGTFWGRNVKSEIDEGDVIIIHKDSEYRFESSAPDRMISMYICAFDPDDIYCPFRTISSQFKELNYFFDFKAASIIVHDTEHKDIRNMMVRMIDEYTYMQPGYEIAVKAYLMNVLVNLFRLCSESGRKKTPDNKNHIIGHMYNYAHKNIHRKISLSEIAKLLHMTPQYICKVFKDNVGMTFVEYCNHIRVEKIKDWLENTDRPLYIIYSDFEFSHRYLNRIFKDQTGYSIKEYKDRFNYKSNNPLYPK